MMNFILQDWEANQGNRKGQGVLILFRAAQWCRRQEWWWVALPYLIVYRVLVEWVLGIELRFKTNIGPGLRLFHGQALVVNERAIIGARCTLRNSTSIGSKEEGGGCPTIGDDVSIGAHAVIIGRVSIGQGARIGAGAVVVNDVAAGAVVAGNPAREIH